MPQIQFKMVPFDSKKHKQPSDKRGSNPQMDELAKALRAKSEPFVVIDVPKDVDAVKVINSIRNGLASRDLKVKIHNFTTYLEVVLIEDLNNRAPV